MIREYGIEPDLLIEWLLKAGAYAHILRHEFGVGTPRFLSRYPSQWEDLVKSGWLDEIKQLDTAASSDADRGRAQSLKLRGDALLEGLVREMIRRDNLGWDEKRGWLSSARQHVPEPLHTLLVRQAQGAPEDVLSGDSIFDSPRWTVPRSRLVPRDAATLAETLAPFLVRSTRVIFVDPWFRPENPHMRAFEAFMKVMARRPWATPPSIQVHTSTHGNKRKLAWDDFENMLRDRIEGILPSGWELGIRWLAVEEDRVEEREGSDKVHNRYILSERGGVAFGTGLDAGKPAHHDDVLLMDRAHFEARWVQHATSPLGFTLARGGKKLVIKGELKVAQPAQDTGSHRRR